MAASRWTDFIDDRIDLEIALRELWEIFSEDNMCLLLLYATGWRLTDIGEEYGLTAQQMSNKMTRLRKRMVTKWRQIESQY